jgi:hypothetical protein
MSWRVGRKILLNVYENDRPMFQCHTPEDAARIVGLLNAADVPGKPPGMRIVRLTKNRRHGSLGLTITLLLWSQMGSHGHGNLKPESSKYISLPF